MEKSVTQPLPISWKECRNRGWSFLDILLITGDAYVDHPSFGVALIGRYLEHHGYKVAILPQPQFNDPRDFSEFPAPRLFCGITAGNLDSIVANYSGNGKVREVDNYSPNGSPWRNEEKNKNNRYRPDRACLIYANLARSVFKNTPIILGGLEASLRRFVHYDYKQDKLRSSFLTDAKADLLVYGMGERTVLEVAKKCQNGQSLQAINGSCERITDAELEARFPEYRNDHANFLLLPSYQKIVDDNEIFLDAELALEKHSRSGSQKIILQKQQHHWVVQHPAVPALPTTDLDALYALKYTRKPHPATPDIPAYTMIKDSVTIVRGCSGNCSFCAISRHQGATVQSRSISSIVKECSQLASQKSFSGTISDLGGPTANLFGTSCDLASCKKRDCLYPTLCKHLKIDEAAFLQLLDEVAAIDKIHHIFISSGMRMELLLQTPKLLKKILKHHTPGAMKIAPEHSSKEVLALMHKEPHSLLQRFIKHCRQLSKQLNKPIKFVPYLISAHPGCTVHHARQLAEDMAALNLIISKFQDFTATPGTLSTAMYVAGRDFTTKKKIYVARNSRERLEQRRMLEKKKKHFKQTRQKQKIRKRSKPRR